MSRVVVIVDSSTGALIDANGDTREGARYKGLAKRMLSLGKPTTVLDYGGNGATRLEVSCNGGKGEQINLMANTVKVTGQLMINNQTIEDIIAGGGSESGIAGMISGKDDEIDVETVQDPQDEERQILQISLAPAVTEALGTAKDAADDLIGGAYVSKDDMASVVDGLYVGDESSLSDVRAVLKNLVERLSALVPQGQS